MLKVWQVAWREFRHTVLRPIFIIAIIGVPVLIIAIMGVAILMVVQHKEPPLVGPIAIVDPNGEVAEAARVEFDPARIDREQEQKQREVAEAMFESGGLTTGTDAPVQRGEMRIEIESITGPIDLDQLQERVRSGELLGIALFDDSVLEVPGGPQENEEAEQPPPQPKYQLYVSDGMDSGNVKRLEERLGLAVVRVRAERAGRDPDVMRAIMRAPQAETARTRPTGEVYVESKGLREVRSQILPMVFMMLIWIGTFSSAQHLMMSTIEEKSNKVMEVLLSAVSPLQLMTGKILGYGAVGLLIVGIYSAVGVAALILLAAFSKFLHWSDLAYLFIYYIMAYFMIAALLAAVGSAVSDLREANTLLTPVMLVVMVPLFLWVPISQAPNGIVAVVCSFIPPAIPFAMILRVVAEETVPLWQVIGSIVWGFICVFGMIWLAAKIFRVGVLMTGKPPNPIELIKWARYS